MNVRTRFWYRTFWLLLGAAHFSFLSVALLAADFDGAGVALLAMQLVAPLSGCFAVFVYTFASPAIWPLLAPAPARAGS